jgi:hypothetical protein
MIEGLGRSEKEAAAGTVCRYLDDFSLESLIAPISRKQFEDEYFQRKVLLVQRGNPRFYDDLFTLKDFDAAVSSGPSYVKIAEAKSKKNRKHETDSASGLDRTLAEMRSGATLVLDSLQSRDAKLGLLCRLLEQELSHRFQTNLYLTPPQGQGFTPHWDNHDVFILQVVGSKHWKIEKERRKLPHRQENMPDEGREVAADADAFTLQQGDLIYIPRGFVHAAECGSESSLHITLGIHPHTYGDVLYAAIRKTISENEALLHALPLGFMHGRRDGVIKAAINTLRRTADPAFLNIVVDEFEDEVVQKYALDVSGQVADFFQPEPLAIGDVVGPRRGIVYRVHPGEDSVRVNVGTRSITFLDIFREALEFALRTPAFAIRELPGDLEDEERIVFIERLMQEGLVVRK